MHIFVALCYWQYWDIKCWVILMMILIIAFLWDNLDNVVIESEMIKLLLFVRYSVVLDTICVNFPAVTEIQTVWDWVKSLASLMRDAFSKWPSGASLQDLSKLYDVRFGFWSPPTRFWRKKNHPISSNSYPTAPLSWIKKSLVIQSNSGYAICL